MSESLQEKKARLRAFLGQRLETTPAPLPVISADEANRYAPFPMTGVQQAYWLGRTGVFALGNISTHVYMEIELRDLDRSRLERAWNDLIARHDMLRVVVSADGMQRVLPTVGTYRVVCDDLREYSEAAREQYLVDLRERTSHRIFQLTEWPLFELRAARFEEHLFRIFVSLDMFFADTRGFRILLQELDQLYEDPSAALPPLTVSFRDYVLGLETLRTTDLYTRAQGYWTKRAMEVPPAPDLPIAKDPSAITRPRFRRRSFVLDTTTWSSLRDRAKQAGLTPSALLVSAFARVLGRWSRSRHFTLTLTFSNRLPVHPQVDALVGDFTSLLLLEIDDRDRQSFVDFATRTQSQMWADMEHRCFDGIEVLRLRNRRTGTPVVMPVVFTSTLGVRTSTDSGGALARALSDSSAAGNFGITQTSQVWLDNVVSEADGRLTITWDALEELFADGVLDAMFRAFESLLVGLATGTLDVHDRCEAALPEDQVDRRRAVNATAAEIPDGLLHEPLREQARRRPFARALIQGDTVLDFATLDRCANVIAQTLREHGARPNELVAVVMVKGWEQIVGVLGILYSGAAYLPIDADLPAQRIASLLAQGGARIVLTQGDVAPRLSWPAGLEVIPIDSRLLDQPFEGMPTPSPARADDLAYVIFTSGSTGVPKGVMIDHRGAVNTIADMNRRFAVGAEDRVLGVSSLAFDLSVYDIFGVMGSGGTLVLPDRSGAKDVRHWIELVTKHGVTMWNSVPIIAQLLVDELAPGPRPSAIASLRLVLMSGDWIPLSLPDRLKAVCPRARVVSLGGATEASIWSIVHVIDRVDETWRSVPYGTPLGNQRFHVLGADLSPAPDWVAGDLFIAGEGLAKGYWGDERATRQAFFEHPVTGERLYRTGDLGRYWPDGTIEFLGREDTQVKIHGHRIELGEIEAALRKDARVRDAVVVVRDAKPGDPRLVAYVLQAETARDAAAARVAHLRGWQQTHEESCTSDERDPHSSVHRDVPERLSSYTGMPLPEDEVRECVDETVARITPLNARCVLEIGCGTGPLLARIAPQCERYVALDCAGGVVRRVARAIGRDAAWSHVDVREGWANDLGFLADDSVDLVILNSVVQYFPDVPYVVEVLAEALRVTKPGGHIFIGDVRSLPLSEAFHTSVQLFQADEQLPAADLRARVQQADENDLELALDPALFRALPGAWAKLGRCEIIPKASAHDNELTRFRYDVLWTVGPREFVTAPKQEVVWDDAGAWWARVMAARDTGEALLVRAVPDGRVGSAVAAVSALRGALPDVAAVRQASTRETGESLHHLFRRAQSLGMPLVWEYVADGAYDIVVNPHWSADAPSIAPTVAPPYQDYGNAPATRRAIVELRHQLRGALAESLPGHLVPAAVVVMAAWPLTPNGKLDARALPPPQFRPEATWQPPRVPDEERLCALFSETLGVSRVGIHDNFFELGGDSLSATRIISAVRSEFHGDDGAVPLDVFWRNPTVAAIAELVALRRGARLLDENRAQMMLSGAEVEDSTID